MTENEKLIEQALDGLSECRFTVALSVLGIKEESTTLEEVSNIIRRCYEMGLEDGQNQAPEPMDEQPEIDKRDTYIAFLEGVLLPICMDKEPNGGTLWHNIGERRDAYFGDGE